MEMEAPFDGLLTVYSLTSLFQLAKRFAYTRLLDWTRQFERSQVPIPAKALSESYTTHESMHFW